MILYILYYLLFITNEIKTAIHNRVSNTFTGGDSNHQQNDAEFQIENTAGTLYESDKCKTTKRALGAVLSDSVSTVTLYVANNFLRVVNDNGMDQRLCLKCLYALNGQSDTGPSGGPNEDVFVALNRVVHTTSSRTGRGVCSAQMEWVCPCTDIYA